MIDPTKADKQFIAGYTHGGHDWSLHFYAADMEDAKRKVTSIRRTLSFDGEAVIGIKLPWFSFDIMRWFKRKP